jgi:branched-chain amino acid transport system substrate-binding protein
MRWWVRAIPIALLVAVACGGTASTPSDKSPIVIGYNESLSGPNGDFTVKTQRGFQLGLDEINKSGGVNGRQIKIITYDAAGDDAKAVTNAQKLINEDNVLAMLGPSPSTNARAAVPVAVREKIVYITWAWQTNIISDEHIFRISNNQAWAAEPLLKYVVSAGFKRIAITAETTSRGDEEAASQTKLVQQQTGAPPVAVIRYAPGAADFTPVALRLKDANPDVIFNNGSSAGDITNEMKAAKRLGVNPNVVWVGPVYAIPSVPKVGGPELVAGAIFSIFVDYDKKEVKNLQAKVTAKWNDTVDYGYVQGYDTAYVLAAALKKSGATANRDSFLNAMQTLKDVPAVGGPAGYKISFSKGINEAHDAYGPAAQVLVAWNAQGLPGPPPKR